MRPCSMVMPVLQYVTYRSHCTDGSIIPSPFCCEPASAVIGDRNGWIECTQACCFKCDSVTFIESALFLKCYMLYQTLISVFQEKTFLLKLSEAFISLSRTPCFYRYNVKAGSGCFMDSDMIQVSKGGHFIVLKVDGAHKVDTSGLICHQTDTCCKNLSKVS